MPRHKTRLIDVHGRECSGCGEYSPWDNYRALKSGINGKMSRCKQCMGKGDRVYAPPPSILIADVDVTWDAVLCQQAYLGRLGTQ